MPRNSSGVYSLPSGNPVVADTLIEADGWANPTLVDLSNEVTNSLDRQGRGGMLAAFKVVDGSAATPGLAFVAATNTGFMRDSSGIRAVVAGSVVCTFGAVVTTAKAALGVTNPDYSATAMTFTGRAGAAGVGGYVSVPGAVVTGWRSQGGVPTSEFFDSSGSMRGEIACAATGMNFYGSTNGFAWYKNLSSGSPQLIGSLTATGFADAASYFMKADSTLGLVATKAGVASVMMTEYRCAANSVGYIAQDTGTHGFCRTNSAGAWTAWQCYIDLAGNFVAAGNITAFSDERLKDVEMAYIGGLHALRNIGTYRVTWKDIPENGLRAGKQDVCVMAQHVRPWLPEAVVEDTTTTLDGEPVLTLNYSKLVVPLISAVQELASMVESADIRHDQKIARLEAALEAALARIQLLEEPLS